MARLRDSSNLHRNYHKKRHIRKGAFTLKHTDNLNHALQGSSMSAGQGQQVAEEVCKTLSRDRSEAAFDLFWTWLLKR